MEGESLRAYRACADYCLSGRSQRDLVAYYREQLSNASGCGVKPPTIYEYTIGDWSKKFNWVERREKWQNRRIDIKTSENLEEWGEHSDRMIKQAKMLSDKAELMLQHPHVKRVVTETYIAKQAGEEVAVKVTFEPAKWSFSTVSEFMKTSADLFGVAVGLDKEPWAIEYLTRLGYQVSRPPAEGMDSNGLKQISPTYLDLSASVQSRN